MSNQHKIVENVVGSRVRHDFSKYLGTITKTRNDIRGYAYFVEWDTEPEHNDWYQLNVLEKVNSSHSDSLSRMEKNDEKGR